MNELKLSASEKELYERLERERPGVINEMRRMIRGYPSANLAAVFAISVDDPPEINELIHKVARLILYEPTSTPTTTPDPTPAHGS